MEQEQRVREIVRKMVEILKVCQHCGTEFWGIKKSKFCSRPCHDTAYRAKHRLALRAASALHYQQRKARRLGYLPPAPSREVKGDAA